MVQQTQYSTIHPPNSLKNPLFNRSGTRGFSIMEIITVMVLISALAGYVVPSLYNSYVSIATTSAVHQVVRDLRYAGEYALAKRDTVWVEFDVGGNSYAIYGGDTVPEKALLESTHGNGGFQVQLGQGEYQRISLTSVNFDGSPTLMIDKFGIPMLTNDGEVVINASYTISVIAGVGTVTLE